MNTQELTRILTPTKGSLTIARDAFGSQLAGFLDDNHRGQPIVISEAELGADGDALVVTGKASFLDVPDLPLRARFSLDVDGGVAVELRYTLRGSNPGPAEWTFARSFPTLPTTWDHSARDLRSILDGLDLFDTAFVVRNTSGRDAGLDVPLAVGINLISRLRPGGLLGALESAAGAHPVLALHGVIRPSRPAEATVALQPFEKPWERLESAQLAPAPGIYLVAALALDFRAGKTALSDTKLRIYSPLTTEWLAANPSFTPLQGLTASLAIASAGITLALAADLHPGTAQTLLEARLSGVSVAKLASLLDLSGQDGLGARLPEALRAPVEALEKLELTYLALDLVLSRGLPNLRTLFFTVGFPNLRWKVWNDDLVVDRLSCLFTIFSPFSAVASGYVLPAFRSRVVPTLIGELTVEGVRLRVQASGDDGFTVRTSTLEPVNLGLGKLVKARGPGVPTPGDLTINYLGVVLAPGKYYALDAQLASGPKPWTIAVGKQTLTVSDVAVSFRVPSAGATTGQLSGKLALFSGASLQVKYQIPGSLVLRASLPPMKLGVVVDRLCDKPVKLPRGLDLDLGWSSVLIQEQPSGTVFQLCSEVAGLGVVAFEVRQAGGAWGFAYGVELSASSASKVPGLGVLAALEKLRLQNLTLVVSSIDQPGFQLPSTAQFSSPRLATKRVALPGSGGVVAGVNIFGEWALDGGDRTHSLLKKLLGLEGTLGVAISVGENPASDTRLTVSRSGKIAGLPFAYKFGVQLTGGVPSYFLTGSVKLEVQKQPQTFDVTALFVASGAFMSASVRGAAPIDFGLFKLGNLGLEIGVNWAGVPSLGVTGVIDVKGFQSSIAVFFDSTDPAKSLVAGSVSDLTLKDVVEALVGPTSSSEIDAVLDSVAIHGTQEFKIPAATAADLDGLAVDKVAAALLAGGKLTVPSASEQVLLCVNKAGESWHLTDLTTMRHYALRKRGDAITVSVEAQIYAAPQATSIGAHRFSQGFYVSGALEILGWSAEATVDISKGRGIKVEAEMDRLVIRNEQIFALTSADGKTGPKLSISTMADPGNPVPELRVPHFYISGALQVLGLKQNVLASLTTKGLLLELKGDLAPGAEFDLDVEIGKKGFSLDGDLKIGVGTIDLGKLGKIRIDTDLEGSLGIRVNAKEISCAVEASFEFLGDDMPLGRLSIEGAPGALANLASTLTKKVEDRLRDEFRDVKKWANAAGKGIVDGVDDTGKVLRDVYGKSEKEAKELADDISKDAKAAVKSVKKTVSKFGKKAKKLF